MPPQAVPAWPSPPLRPSGPSPTAWAAALAGALALHAALLLWTQRVDVRPPAQSRPAAWHVSFRTAAAPAPAPAPTAAPAPVAPVPAPPEPATTPAPSPQPRPRVRPAPKPPRPAPPAAAAPEPPAEPPQPPASSALPDTSRTTRAQGGWLEATNADQAPAPIDNTWRLADGPWPKTQARIVLQLWISSQGVIERYELQGDAAQDRAIQALIAPIIETPMTPAMIGRVPVPSTMRIELWEGDAGVPDFVGPLAPDAARGATR